MITGFGLIWQIMLLFNVISANLQQKKVCERLILAINKNSFVRNFVFPGTYILTTALIPALKKVEDPRVVGWITTAQKNNQDVQMHDWKWTISSVSAPDYCVFRWHAHTEIGRGRPPIWEGDIWRDHGLRSE